MSVGTKRERLLDWIRNGDPEKVPILLGPGFEVPGAYLGKDQREVTWSEAIRVAEETGTHNMTCVYSPGPFDAVPFLDDVSLSQTWDKLPDGTGRFTEIIDTPQGQLKAVQEFPSDKGSYHTEFFVKGPQDLKPFAYLIRSAAEAVINRPAVVRAVDEKIKTSGEKVGRAFPIYIHFFCGAVELMSSNYMGQETALMTIYDERELMEELMDCHWQMTRVWLDLAARNEIDLYNYAINGLEWLSPDIYERYMIPQARRINEFAAAHGKLSWIHTCGKLRKLAADRVYQRMKVDLVESLSSPPTGDIADLAATRRDIGPEITTRGGVNVEYFYGSDRSALVRQTEYVLESTRGFRHMLGDTNSSYPSYPWANIQAVIDRVKATGRLLE